jgi:three-Cys-motif partner protein
MPPKNLHNAPFGKSTLTKLQIFQLYAREWLPVFHKLPYIPEITIIDYFAGPGYDVKGVPGSPIRILEEIRKCMEMYPKDNTKVCVHFNECHRTKNESLQKACNAYIQEYPQMRSYLEMQFYCEDFDVCFNKLRNDMGKNPSLIYLDQNGIKHLQDKYISFFLATKRIDFLYFVASSYIKRFRKTAAFRLYCDDALLKIVDTSEPLFIHRKLVEYLNEKYSHNANSWFVPFSLRKGKNVYGIVLGASNPKAVEKFLKVTWDQSEANGEANFDIDDDSSKAQLILFGEKEPDKRESFLSALEKYIKDKKTVTNAEVYEFTLKSGFPLSRATEHLRQLKREKKIHFEGSGPQINYKSWKNKDKPVIIRHTHQ